MNEITDKALRDISNTGDPNDDTTGRLSQLAGYLQWAGCVELAADVRAALRSHKQIAHVRRAVTTEPI